VLGERELRVGVQVAVEHGQRFEFRTVSHREPPWESRQGTTSYAQPSLLRAHHADQPDPGDKDPGTEISSWAGLGLKH